MLLKEWEIWKTYSTYFIDPINDLHTVARNLVDARLLRYSLLDDGSYYWQEGNVVLSGKADVYLEPNLSEASIQLNKKLPDDFAFETIMESLYFRFAELKQFGQNKTSSTGYIRGHIGECRFVTDKHTYCVYPSIKLYGTGVMLVELRIIHPKALVNTKEFIEEFLSLYKFKFRNIFVPPSLHINGQHAFTASEKSKWPLLLRLGSWLVDKDITKYVDQNIVREKSGGFDFEFVPLWEVKEKTDERAESNGFLIDDLIFTIFQSVSIAALGLRRGKSLLFNGPNKYLELGSHWRGHPHIYLIEFNGQANLAQQNENKFKNDLGWIMAGVYGKPKGIGKKYLPPSSRNFSDYGAYIANQATLWVWSKTGLDEMKKWEVPNRGHVIYLHQSICEMLDYGFSLHRRMLELVSKLDTFDDALNLKQTLVNLEMEMQNLSPYGEISDLLQKGWNDMGVDRLRSAISEIIALKQTQTSISEQRQSFIWQMVLTLVFGLLLIPSIASDLIKPIWELSGLSRAQNENLAALVDMVLALPIVSALILFFWKLLKK